MRRARRNALPAVAVSLAFFAAAASVGAAPAGGALTGSVYAQPWPAADFSLTQQDGKTFHMADTRGKVVVLSFIYTHCTDFCPFVALKLKEARLLLGANADKAEFVAVTTDPLRDTQKVIADYSNTIGMFDSWHFVTGPLHVMRKVWKDYFIGVEMVKEGPARAPAAAPDPEADQEAQKVSRGLGTEDRSLAGTIIERFGGGYEVSHDIPFWIVDKRGMMRVTLDADASPADIAHDLRLLLEE